MTRQPQTYPVQVSYVIKTPLIPSHLYLDITTYPDNQERQLCNDVAEALASRGFYYDRDADEERSPRITEVDYAVLTVAQGAVKEDPLQCAEIRLHPRPYTPVTYEDAIRRRLLNVPCVLHLLFRRLIEDRNYDEGISTLDEIITTCNVLISNLAQTGPLMEQLMRGPELNSQCVSESTKQLLPKLGARLFLFEMPKP